jgi:hypothetical protein
VRPYVLGTPAEHESTSRRLFAGLGADLEPVGLGGLPPPGASSAVPYEVFGLDRP